MAAAVGPPRQAVAPVPEGKRLGGRRALKVKVRSAKRRKASSTQWLERQLNDPYVAAARAEGYRARSAFKLVEIDDRFHLLAPGKRVVDLGAAPGGWSQVAAARVRSTAASPLVVAVDILDVDPIPGVVILKRDILDEATLADIREALGGATADVVLSDMAAPTVGHRQTDHLRTTRLTEAAVDVALAVLKPGGDFVAKAFRGGTENELLARLKQAFTSVKHVKPPASRAESVELYIVARGFRAVRTLQPRSRMAVTGSGTADWRPDNSSPASSARRLNGIIAASAISPTTMNAGQNAVAVIAPPCASLASSSVIAPTEIPSDSDNCCATLVSVVALVIRCGGMSAKASALTLVNCSERKKPPMSSRT